MVDFQSRETRRGEATDSDGSETPDEPVDGPPDEDTGAETDAVQTTAGPGTGDDGVLGFAVVTVGLGRSMDEDVAGEAVVTAVEDVGDVVTRELIDAQYDGVQSTVGALVERGDVDVLVTVGGTGVEPGDVTVEAVEPLLDKHLPGVGELIRRHYVEHSGTAAVRTRATGGTLDGVPVFCVPGDPDLAEVAAVEVVVPEAGTLADLAALPVEEE